MKQKHRIKIAVLVVSLLLGLVAQLRAAGPALLVKVPSDPVWAIHDTGTQGTYFDVVLQGVGSGYDVEDGVVYAGHCFDRNSYRGTSWRTLYSSYDPDMPPDVQVYDGEPIPWDKLNYLINHKQGTAHDIQAAIEVLIFGNSIYWPITPVIQAMLDDANANGVGFVPGPGEVVAVILRGNGVSQQDGHSDWIQESFIEVPVPQLAALGDYVWLDLDEDGIQDANEPGLNGVTVNLYDCAGEMVASTVTADDAEGKSGYYLFEDLFPGCYEVEFVRPDGYTFSPQNAGADNVDSDADQTTGRTGSINLDAGETDLTWDAGLVGVPAALGDYVWLDQDVDGIQDANEPGIENVTVNLYDCDGNMIASTVTSGTGYYLFDNLAPGCYEVEFVRPDGYAFSPQDQGFNDGVDSDADRTTGRTGSINLDADETDLTWDAGLYQFAALGDYVWQDDGDGIQEEGEPGLNGVTVNLYDCAGDMVASTVTADDASGNAGYYLFEELAPGCYEVEFELPDGYTFSPQDAGADNVDSDADPTTGRTGKIKLSAGETDLTWDAGVIGEPAALGDYVWLDQDVDGIQDGNETGINDVTVNLYDCDGNTIASTVTADDDSGNAGYYLFENLAPGCYEVEFVRPDGYAFSPEDQGANDGADSDAGTATGRTGEINLSAGETDLTWDAGLYQPVCDLIVEKLCQVPVPPTEFVCSDAKPIDELTMVWNGTQTVRVVAWYGSVGSTIVGTADNVAPGDEVTISGFAGSPNDVYWEIFEGTTKLGESVFHLSCSDNAMNGPEDCGTPQGDGKGDDSSKLNGWLLEGIVGENGMALVCTPETPDAGSKTCEATLPPAPNCETLDKPYELTFRYTGETCAASDNDQGSKFECTDVGAINPGQPVEIVYTGKDPDKFTVSPATVSVGQEVTIEATGRSEFHSQTKLELYQGGVLKQSLNIHTSCSAPLAVGDQFAGLELVGFNGQDGGAEVIYTYQVTNYGFPLIGVHLDDIPLGPIAGPFDLASGESRTFQATAYVVETITNQATAAGTLVSGQACAFSDLATVNIPEITESCAECKGGTTELTFRYQGTQAANVAVYDDSDAKADKLLFQGLVEPGDEFTITPRPGQDDLNNDVSIWVDGVFHYKIHTSCSQPIGPGMVVGDFEVVSSRSKDNGPMCELDVCSPQPAPEIEFHDREIKWNVTNTGDLGLEIKRITLSWPAANGYLDEVKRDGDTIHKGNFAPPSAVIDSGWEGDANKRTIKPGETDTLKFKFQNNADTQGEYEIVVEFTAGCSIETEYVPDQEPQVLVCTSKIQATTLRYTGPNRIKPTQVEIDPDRGATVTYNLRTLMTGTVLTMPSQNDWTIDATVGGESDLGAKTKIRINGVEEVIHTSCSVPYAAGAPAPLDNPKGAPSTLWFVEAFRQK